MSYVKGPATVTVVRSGTIGEEPYHQCACFADLSEMVDYYVLRSAAASGCWGSPEHLAWLQQLHAQLTDRIKEVEVEAREYEANL
jgi:hypothetical protein